MAEITPTDNELIALSGTTDNATGMYYIPEGTGVNWYAEWAKHVDRINRILAAAAAFRVYKDGALTFGVYPGKFLDDDDAVVSYAGATAQALSDDETNYIYLINDGTLTVNTTGFLAGVHMPLATIVAADGAYALSDITDYRDAAIYRVRDTTVI